MVAMSERHSILRDTAPAPPSADTQGPSEEAPTVRGADIGDFYTECIERLDMEGTHYYAPRFGRADLARMVVHAQCEVDRSGRGLRPVLSGPKTPGQGQKPLSVR